MKVRCWQCGAVVPADEAVRVTETTDTFFFTAGTQPVGGARARRVDLCPDCAAMRRRRHDYYNGLVNAVALPLVLGVAVLGMLFLGLLVIQFLFHPVPL